MKKWLIPGAGVFAAVAAIAVAVIVVASPFDSNDSSAQTRTEADADSGDAARCAAEATDCVDPNGGVSSAVCAPDVGPDGCNDTAVDDGTDGSLNMCIAGVVDCDDTVSSDPGEPVASEADDATASTAAIRALATRLGVEPEAIDLLSNEPTEWPDSCLGVEQADILCAQVITPGYKVLMENSGTQYEYHTDLAGTAIAVN